MAALRIGAAAPLVVELGAGIALAHGPEGWFVVGAGRNGMEYSVLLILVLASVAHASPREGTGGGK